MSAVNVKRTVQPSLDVRCPSRSPRLVVLPSAVASEIEPADRGIVAEASAFASVEQSVLPKLAEPVTSKMGIQMVFDAPSTTRIHPVGWGFAVQRPAGWR